MNPDVNKGCLRQHFNWDYHDPETAVVGTALHAFEFIFVRIAPFVFAGALVGAVMTRKNK